MSKTSDKIKSLLAEYEGRHPGARKQILDDQRRPGNWRHRRCCSAHHRYPDQQKK